MAKKKTQFDDLPDNIKKLVEDISKTYTPPEVKPKVYNGKYDNSVDSCIEAAERKKERKKYFDEAREVASQQISRVKISKKELEDYRKTEEKRKKERYDLITVQEKVEDEKPISEQLEELIPKEKKDGIWDFGIEDEIPFFDINLSYELTGYRPINETEGLDFNPENFIKTRRHYERTGHFTLAPKGRKDYDDFWYEEYQRLNNGLEVNGYKITGDHYYFLNYYQLMDTENVQYAGQGRESNFAEFYVAQYEYFHYVELCKHLLKNCLGLKGRGLG